MSDTKELIDTLKKVLKTEGLTYADVAKKLQLSEISIKRNFAAKNFTLDRLEEICGLCSIDLTDLIRIMDDARAKVSSMTIEQEEELVTDLKYLLVAISVQNAWQMDEIVKHYKVTESECLRYLIRLERHGLIHLLPNNRVRRMLAHDFRWLPDGPIEKFFEQHVQQQFLQSHFNGEGELRIYLTGMLSKHANEIVQKRMAALAREYKALQDEEVEMPVEKRANTGFFMALRPWQLSVFAEMRRDS